MEQTPIGVIAVKLDVTLLPTLEKLGNGAQSYQRMPADPVSHFYQPSSSSTTFLAATFGFSSLTPCDWFQEMQC